MDFLGVAKNFLELIWEFIVNFFTFLVDNVSRVENFFEFIFSFILELPNVIIPIFNSLPDFMKTGILTICTGIFIIFTLKIIKLIRDCTI